MLCLLILCILQSTLTGKRTTHASRVTHYWQTIDPTDQVVDYWNHGPDLGKVIEQKKFQVFTLTTKRPDIFPPWLTRGTTESTRTLLPSRVFLRTRATPKKTTTATTANVLRHSATNSVDPGTRSKTRRSTENHVDLASLYLRNMSPRVTKIQQEAESTDPFSVFLRKLFKVLTRKTYLELQMLVGPFVRFMTVLLENRFLNWFGKNVTEYLGETLKNIERSSPTMLHEKCQQAYKAMSKRSTVLDADMNELLDLVDDMFDAAEEETMQDVLQHVSQYPNTSKSAEALVHDLIDAVVFKPVIRVNGTLKGDHLLKILSEVVANRIINSRRNIYDIDVYDLVRLNIENIRNNVNKMNDSSSSEESKEVKILRSDIKTTKIVKNKGLETKYFIKNLINNLEQLQIIIEKLEIPSASNEYDIEYSDRSEGDLLKRNKRKTLQPSVFHFKQSDKNIPRKGTLRVAKRYSEKHNVGFETTTDYIRQHSKQKSMNNPKKFSLSKHIFDTIKRDVSILKMRRPITQPVARTITYPSPNSFKIPNTTAKPSNEFGGNNNFNIDSELHMGKKEKLREQHSLPRGAEIHTTEVEHSSRYIGIENIPRKDTLRVHMRYSEKHNVGFETTTDYIRQHSKHKSIDNPKKVYLSKNIFDTMKRDVSILKMRRPITQPVARTITYPSPNSFKIANTTAGSNNNFNIDSELYMGIKEKLREQHSLPGEAEIHTTEAEHSSGYIGDQSQNKQDPLSKTTQPQKALKITKRQTRKQVKIVHENKNRESEIIHGETHHNRKKKYHRLKRKYERLKEITNMILRSRDSNAELDEGASWGQFDKKAGEIDLKAKIAKIDELRDKLVKNFKELLKVSKGVKENFPESTTVNRKRKLKINMLLDDEQNVTNQNEVFNSKNKAHNVLSGKALSQSKSAGYVTTYSTTEFSRKKTNNIFKSFRRSNDAAPVIQPHNSQSQETDMEPVLKSNIYKAVKETLKNSTLKPL